MEIEGVAQPNTKNQESVTLSNNEGNAQKVVNDAQNGENQVNGVLIYQTDSEKDLIQVKKVKMKKIKMKIKNQMKLHVLKNSLLTLQKEQWLIQFLICQ